MEGGRKKERKKKEDKETEALINIRLASYFNQNNLPSNWKGWRENHRNKEIKKEEREQ
jgi:hypothetical protein